MGKSLATLFEFLGFFGVAGLLIFVPWTKMLLGSFLAILGAFFPHPANNKPDSRANKGNAQVQLPGVLVKLSGGLRLFVVGAGIVLIVASTSEGQSDYDNFLNRFEEMKANNPECTTRRTISAKKPLSAATIQEMRLLLSTCTERNINEVNSPPGDLNDEGLSKLRSPPLPHSQSPN